MRKYDEPACEWCGTRFRGRRVCPRGPGCRKEEANHRRLMDRIERAKKEERDARVA